MKLKKILALAAIAVFGGVNSFAQFDNGEYLIRNVETGGYLQGDSYWGTKAVAKDVQYLMTLTKVSNGVYTIKSQQNNGGDNQFITSGEDPYVDGASCNMTFTKDGDYYTINNGNGNLYTVSQTEDNATFYKVMAGNNTTNNAKWEIISKQSVIDDLNNATASNPKNATIFIKDAGFDMKSVNFSNWKNAGAPGGGNAGHVSEQWNVDAFDVYQNITGIPNGKYILKCRGFYRYNNTGTNNNAAAIAAHAAGTEILQAKLYAGAKETPLMSVANYDGTSETLPYNSTDCDGMWKAAANFTQGFFLNELEDVIVTDGTLRIGVKKSAKNGTDWTIFDDFQLYYLGVDLTALKENLASLITTAKGISGKMNGPVATALSSAITAAEGCEETQAAIEQATSDLNTAVLNAQASVAHYASVGPALAAQKALIDGTNVYGDGFETYRTNWETLNGKYEANTLTNDETVVNPSVATGWHASTAYNFLLTPWKLGESACNEFANALYINTWSGEGATDGSNFTVPFFEYWVADAESLANNTLSATVTGLENGLYSTTAWIRVRAKNGVAANEATGINLVAGDGSYAGTEGNGTVDATEGAQVGTSQFTLAEVTAYSLVKDGNLNIALNVADANISWLSFKNVKYTKVRDLTPEEQAVVPTAIALNKTEATLTAAENTVTLTPTFTPGDATETVTWETSDANVATVANGVVTGVTPGTATITVKSTLDENVKATCEVTVEYIEAAVPNEVTIIADNTKTTYTLSSTNIVKNGAFEYPDHFYGHNGGNGSKLTAGNWNIDNNEGDYFITSTAHAGAGDAKSYSTHWAIESGKKYVFGYSVKHKTGVTDMDYLKTSLDKDGDYGEDKVISTKFDVPTDWINLRYVVDNTDGAYKYVQLRGRWLGAGLGYDFDNFFLAEVTDEVSVEKKSAKLSVSSAKYGTFIAPFDAEIPAGVTAYTVNEISDNNLVLEEDNDGFNANTAYVVYSESEVNETLEGWNQATEDSYTTGLLTGVYTQTTAPVDSYVLQNNNDKVAFYLVAEGKQPKVGANRCYLNKPAGSEAKPVFFFEDDNVTATPIVVANNSTVANGKYLKNGKLIIVKDGKKFNAAAVEIK